MRLSELPDNSSFSVDSVTVAGEIGKRIAEMGFTAGVHGHVVRRALLGDPIEVCLLGYHVSLRKAEADGIAVTEIKKCRGCKSAGVKA